MDLPGTWFLRPAQNFWQPIRRPYFEACLSDAIPRCSFKMNRVDDRLVRRTPCAKQNEGRGLSNLACESRLNGCGPVKYQTRAPSRGTNTTAIIHRAFSTSDRPEGSRNLGDGVRDRSDVEDGVDGCKSDCNCDWIVDDGSVRLILQDRSAVKMCLRKLQRILEKIKQEHRSSSALPQE